MFSKIPEVPPEYIPVIKKLAQKAWNWLKDKFKKVAQDAGRLEPITQETAIEDIAKINEIFSDFKESVEKQANEIEASIGAEIIAYTDELWFTVNGGNAILSKYNINLNRFKRHVEKLNIGIKGTMQKEISKRISLDNPDCKRVIKMLPGTKKEEEFKSLLNMAINSGIEAINEKVESIVENILDDFEVALNDCMELIEKESISQIRLFADAEMQSDEGALMKDMVKSNANIIVCSCNIIENLFGEEY